jgi:hypothetical protein
MLIRSPAALHLLACALALSSVAATNAVAQTPGEWRYTIKTDRAQIPADMRVNFPTIDFSVCRSADDFASGRAFALQTLASSAARCPSSGFVRTQSAPGSPAAKGDSLSFSYACDAGQTLIGTANGRIQATRFVVNLESRYLPPVGGVDVVKQVMTGSRIGACMTGSDSRLVPVK